MNGNQKLALGMSIVVLVAMLGCATLCVGSFLTNKAIEATPVVEATPTDISCVQRAEFGEKIGYGTETWDAETRVWVLEDFVCEGPYCYTYDACRDPEAAIELQPFFLGYELSPVTGEKFKICYDFEGDCAR